MPVSTVLFSIAASHIVFSSSSFENVRGNSEGRVGIRFGIFNARRGEKDLRCQEVWFKHLFYFFLRSSERSMVRVKACISNAVEFNTREDAERAIVCQD